MLWSHPIFAGTIVVVIALGLGLSLAAYRAAKAVLWKQPAVEEPDRLLYLSSSGRTRFAGGLTPVDYIGLNQPNSALAGVLSYGRDIAISPVGDRVQTLLGEMVSDNYFEVLGVRPFIGAPISIANAGEAVVVISEGLWRSRFSADPNVIGQDLLLLPSSVGAISAKPTSYRVVGVVSSRYQGLLNAWERVQYWVPFRTRALEYRCDQPDILDRWPLGVVARAAPGTSTDVATQALLSSQDALRRANHPDEPDWTLTINRSRTSALPVQGRRRLLPATATMAAAFVALLVMVVAVINASGLLLARATDQRQSATLRIALGCGRLRLARQLLLETTLLSLTAGLLSWPLSTLLTQLALSTLPEAVRAASMGESTSAPRLDSTELLVGLAAVVLVGALIGLLPLRASLRADVRGVIEKVFDSSGGLPRSLQFAILAPLVALTVVALGMAVTVGLDLNAAARKPLGYDPTGVTFAEFQIARPPGCEQNATTAATYFTKRDRILSSILGGTVLPHRVTAVAMALPGDEGRTWILSKGQSKADDRYHYVGQNSVSEQFFNLLRISLVAGRSFSGADQRSGARVAVISESLGRLLFPNATAVGRSIALHSPESSLPPVPIEIVGVVTDVRHIGADAESTPTLYTPNAQWTGARVVLAADSTLSAVALADALTSLDNDVSVSRAAGLNDLHDERRRPQVAVASLLGYAAATALVLSAVGLFGVVSSTMAKRRREVCIRMFLGARTWSAIGPDIRTIVGAVLSGILLGSSVCVPLWGLARHFQLGLPDLNPLALGVVALTMMAVSAGAVMLPVSRASRVSPVELLKE